MKKLYFAVAIFFFVAWPARLAQAQVYAPDYYYPSYEYETPYSDAPYYDPYYQLHVLHYQLYLPPYPYYYCCAPAVVVPPRPPAVIQSAAPWDDSAETEDKE